MTPAFMQMCREGKHQECLWGQVADETFGRRTLKNKFIMGVACFCPCHLASTPVVAVVDAMVELGENNLQPE